MNLVEVYIEDPFLNNDTLTYHSERLIASGVRVLVPVQTSMRIGFVKRSYVGDVDFKTKSILEIIDEEPIVNQELLQLGIWLSKHTLNPVIRCFQAILPNQLRPSSSFQKKQEIVMVRLVNHNQSLTKRQQEVVDDWSQDLSLKDARQKYKSIIDTLVAKGVLEKYSQIKTYQPKAVEIKPSQIKLNSEQVKVLSEIDLTSNNTYLLHGITGSGKTEIYLQSAAEVLSTGKQVLVLVPEISLTPQMIDRFQKRFGQDIGIYHSGLNAQEKYEQYLRVQHREVSIVVGTRSAVFMPFSQLGLIVMDEEHDDSFKQDSAPFYHARDVAKYRANYHHCPLLLGSASPSLDSYARAYKGNYKLVELKNRVNQNLPQIHLVDMEKELRALKYQTLSNELQNAIGATLRRGEQVLLLLNRRSYAPILRCSSCHSVIMCPNCDTTLSYHKGEQVYRCHTCDYQTSQLSCPNCQHSVVEMKGVGTEKLQEIVSKAFPTARILRMDRDTTSRKNAHSTMLKDFSDHEYDILIGTQMIAKGLDIPKVTCVGILSPDSALLREDFSGAEHVFSLILQASGRAGRANLPGHVYIQTLLPDHYAIQLALKQDYVGFFNHEMRYRHMGNYPPYSYLIEIIFTGMDEGKLQTVAHHYQEELKQNTEFRTLGPVTLRRVKTLNRMRIILKGKDLELMSKKLGALHDEAFKQMKGVRVMININPLHITS